MLVAATSGRSKCKACVYLGGDDPTIQMGSMRVGIPGHARGVTVFHYCHPACFAKYCLRVDTAPTGRARCKADGSEISKGATRLLIGYKKEASLFKVENAQRTIVPKLVALVGRTNVAIHGLDVLSLDERTRVEVKRPTRSISPTTARYAAHANSPLLTTTLSAESQNLIFEGGGTGSGGSRGGSVASNAQTAAATRVSKPAPKSSAKPAAKAAAKAAAKPAAKSAARTETHTARKRAAERPTAATKKARGQQGGGKGSKSKSKIEAEEEEEEEEEEEDFELID